MTGFTRACLLLLRASILLLLACSLLRWVPGGWGVPDHLRIGLLWLALPLLVVTMTARRWLLLVPLGLSVLVNAALVFPTWLSPAAGQGASVTLLHTNVWNQNPSMDAWAALVRERRPDLAVVLERHYHHQAYAWAVQLAEILPYHADCGISDCGNNVLSRWPLRQIGVTTSPWHDAPTRPSFLAVRVERPEGPFTLVTAHLSRPFDRPVQEAQVDWLLDRLREMPPPVLLAGDFNAAPWSPLMRRIMRDAGLVRLSVTGPTWPSGWLLPFGIPIDHVLGGSGIGAGGQVLVLRDVGSDHRPVLVRFTLPAADAGTRSD
ncbi:endonuclease/exonuclease/phosphatase family protein [Niveispirillum fermenti]|uniref:endonuclease/exonuclease/phosphatase family protein n=1 Tax=Niveispirillum fermenti TaxID=1233113 RepID=UPI003A8ADDD8